MKLYKSNLTPPDKLTNENQRTDRGRETKNTEEIGTTYARSHRIDLGLRHFECHINPGLWQNDLKLYRQHKGPWTQTNQMPTFQ